MHVTGTSRRLQVSPQTLVWADMFLPESRERRIQVKGNDVLQVCEAYWEDW